jgi:nucleoside-diphosphate-sugar epimerase
MRILVTGGAGFIGSHLCERLLAEGHDVVAVDNFITGNSKNLASFKDNPHFTLFQHDICTPFPKELVGKTNIAPGYGKTDELKFDQIYHLACPASPRDYREIPLQTLLVNSAGVKNVLEVAVKHSAAFLLASSSEVYGDPEVHPQTESYWGNVNPIGERSCYSEGKRFAESMAVNYYHQYGFPLKIARIFNTYGPRMRRHDGRVIPDFIQAALDGEPLRMHGGGEQTRSFCYIDDMVNWLVLAMNHPKYLGPVNLGCEDEITIKKLGEKIIALTESSSLLVETGPADDDPKRRRPDLTLAKSAFGYEPKVSLEEGLKKTIEYFKA